MMSSIIPELMVTSTNHFNDNREATNQSTLLPEPAIKIQIWEALSVLESKENIRLPCIHKREGVDFHFLKVLLWKNQVAVPSWWALQAVLWLTEESGGESHLWNLSCCAISLACLSSGKIDHKDCMYNQKNSLCTPSMRTFTLSSTLCVILNTSAVAILASSWVSLSSLFKASSTSFLPSSFFRNFSMKNWVKIQKRWWWTDFAASV